DMETEEALRKRVQHEQGLVERLRTANLRFADAQLERMLTIKFAHASGLSIRVVRCGAGGLPKIDKQKAVKFLGHDATCEGVLLRALAHANEHLGQMIAYARVNGVTPPWLK